jgi:hypothetical protein
MLRVAALCAAFVIPARAVAAQVPASPAPTASLSGIVSAAGGLPLAGVNVTLIGESLAARSDTTGAFTLSGITPGPHTALFRRLGYRSVDYRFTARAGVRLEVAVTMAPAPHELERVVIEAPGVTRRRGTSSIGGTVSDSLGAPVVGADVRLLAAGLRTVTDSQGQFEFRSLAAGSYIVRARARGLRSANAVMQIVDDDNRGITMKMFGLGGRAARDSSAASGYGVADIGYDAFDRRERSSESDIVLGPADLVRNGRTPLDILLQQYRDMTAHTASIGSIESDDCLLVNGQRALYQPLGSFRSVDVQLVEAFRKNAIIDPYVASEMDAIAECRGTGERHPPYFALWTRAMK